MDNSKLLLDAVKSGKEMLVQVLISRGVSVTSSDQVFTLNYEIICLYIHSLIYISPI